MARYKKVTIPGPVWTTELREAYRWCINNGIYISPFATGDATWYIEIKINGKTNRSPDVYSKTAIWIKMYEFYEYYYNKYEKRL